MAEPKKKWVTIDEYYGAPEGTFRSHLEYNKDKKDRVVARFNLWASSFPFDHMKSAEEVACAIQQAFTEGYEAGLRDGKKQSATKTL